MIDFHSHILPGIDDGSKTTKMTEEMIHIESEQGVDKIIATPHFYASEVSMDHFLTRRNRALDKVYSRIYENADRRLPEIIPGAEVYYFPGMGRADLSCLCIGATSLLLLEMPFAQWTQAVYEDVKNIIRRQKLTVIIAHAERYYKYQKSRRIWDQVFALPVIVQFNAGCLARFGDRRLAFRFMKSSYPTLLGSDCHNTSTRRPNLLSGRTIVEKKLGKQKLVEIDTLGQRLLEDRKEQAI